MAEGSLPVAREWQRSLGLQVCLHSPLHTLPPAFSHCHCDDYQILFTHVVVLHVSLTCTFVTSVVLRTYDHYAVDSCFLRCFLML